MSNLNLSIQTEEKQDTEEFHTTISFNELNEINLERYVHAPENEIEQYIRSLAEKASIGQLRQVMEMWLTDDDLPRQDLIDRFVRRKMSTVRSLKNAQQAIRFAIQTQK